MTKPKSGLAALAAEIPHTTRNNLCTFAEVYRKLNTKDTATLNEILADVDWRHSMVSELLKRYGFRVAADTVSRHRRGLCSCTR